MDGIDFVGLQKFRAATGQGGFSQAKAFPGVDQSTLTALGDGTFVATKPFAKNGDAYDMYDGAGNFIGSNHWTDIEGDFLIDNPATVAVGMIGGAFGAALSGLGSAAAGSSVVDGVTVGGPMSVGSAVGTPLGAAGGAGAAAAGASGLSSIFGAGRTAAGIAATVLPFMGSTADESTGPTSPRAAQAGASPRLTRPDNIPVFLLAGGLLLAGIMASKKG